MLDRDHEWALLRDFVADPAPQLRMAILSGRRRNGKSFLLEALTEAVGGLYLTAVQEEGRRAREAWRESRPTFHSKILGPHFEGLARQWARSFAPDEAGLRAGVAGTTQVPDPQARTTHEVDVLALATGERPQSAHARIALIGEAEATIQPRGLPDVQRLEHIRDLLTGLGYRTEHTALALFSLHGFHSDVHQAATRRKDLLLIDLPAVYGEGPVRGGQ